MYCIHGPEAVEPSKHLDRGCGVQLVQQKYFGRCEPLPGYQVNTPQSVWSAKVTYEADGSSWIWMLIILSINTPINCMETTSLMALSYCRYHHISFCWTFLSFTYGDAHILPAVVLAKNNSLLLIVLRVRYVSTGAYSVSRKQPCAHTLKSQQRLSPTPCNSSLLCHGCSCARTSALCSHWSTLLEYVVEHVVESKKTLNMPDFLSGHCEVAVVYYDMLQDKKRNKLSQIQFSYYQADIVRPERSFSQMLACGCRLVDFCVFNLKSINTVTTVS